MRMTDEPPKTKHVSYTQNMDFTEDLIPTRVSHVVHYSYTEYESLCREHGCDLEAGRRPGSGSGDAWRCVDA